MIHKIVTEDRAISLNDLLEVMHEMWGDSGELLDAIKELPPVTPQRPKGRWLKRHYVFEDRMGLDMWVCTNCREEYSYDAETGVGITDAKFCPNCGADMRANREDGET